MHSSNNQSANEENIDSDQYEGDEVNVIDVDTSPVPLAYTAPASNFSRKRDAKEETKFPKP